MAFTRQQVQTFRELASAPQYRQAGPKVRRALTEAGIVESNLTNTPGGDRDSIGVLQQRPSQGWGTPQQLGSVRYQAEQFLKRAIPIAGKYGTAGQLAQAVQRSAYPERYDQHGGEAAQLLKAAGGTESASGPFGGSGQGTGPQVQTNVSEGGPDLSTIVSLVKAISGPKALAAQAQIAPPSTSAQPIMPNGAHPVPGITPKPASSSLLPLLEQALAAGTGRKVESSLTPGTPAASAPGEPGGPTPKGLADFGGKQVAAWIAPALQYAREHGWKGDVSSGYRSFAEQKRIYDSGVRPAAVPGTSNHEGTDFPRGAVDVTEAAQLAKILAGSPYRGKLVWAGAKDPVHFSHPHGGSY